MQLERERKEAEEKSEDNGEETGVAENVYLTDPDWRMSVVCCGGVFLFTLVTAMIGICGNLRREPLELLAMAESGQ